MMKSNWIIQRISILIISASVFCCFESFSKTKARRSLAEIVQTQDFPEENSLWESDPIEISEVNVQILDKVSGKVFKGKMRLNHSVSFGTISLVLKKCFKTSPEDKNEIYAFIAISENDKVIFANWLFASSPSTNLFCHPMYNVQIEF